MAQLNNDAFVQALQSETVTLKVGPKQGGILVSKALLAHMSDFFAKCISKPGSTELELPGVGVAVSKMFVCWCYQERLQNLAANATSDRRREWKELMIDLWLFADEYGIPRLQNQIMTQLTKLFVAPSLLEKDDLKYVWGHSDAGLTSGMALKELMVLVLVAQLQASNATKVIGHYEDMAGLPGYTTLLYKALEMYLTFEVPVKHKNKKWALLLQDDELKAALRVEEKGPVTTFTMRAAPKGFERGEVIEID